MMRRCFMTSWLAGVLWLPIVMAQGDAERAPAAPVVVSLECRQAIVVLGDPVLTRLTVANPADAARAILIPDIQRFGPDGVEFHLSAPDATEYSRIENPDIFIGAWKSRPRPASRLAVTIGPGKSETFDFVLHYDFPTDESRRWLFAEPGEYRLKTVVYYLLDDSLAGKAKVPMDVESRRVESGPLVVAVIKPESAADQDAFRAMHGLRDEYLMYAPDVYHPEIHPEAVGAVEVLLGKYTQSRYADYFRLFLAHARFTLALDQEDRALLDKALAMSRRVESVKSFPLVAKAGELSAKIAAATAEAPQPVDESGIDPVEPPRKTRPVDDKERGVIERIVRQYFTAMGRGEADKCAAMLGDGFTFRDVFDKAAYREEIEEDCEKARKLGGIRFETEFSEVVYVEDVVEARFEYAVYSKDELIGGPVEQSWKIKQIDAGWRIAEMR